MTDIPVTPEAGRFEVRATADTHFGWLRTRVALERTMMAWLRTAISLIGFGFAIVQFYDELRRIPGTLPPEHPEAPKYMGLALISCGVLTLVVSIWQYWWEVGYLRSESFACIAGIEGRQMRFIGLQTPVVAIAILLCAIGLGAFFAVLFRLV